MWRAASSVCLLAPSRSSSRTEALLANPAGQGSRSVLVAEQQRQRGGIDPRPAAAEAIVGLGIQLERASQVGQVPGVLAMPSLERETLVRSGENTHGLLVVVPLRVKFLQNQVGPPRRATTGQRQRQELLQARITRKMLQTLAQQVVAEERLAQFEDPLAQAPITLWYARPRRSSLTGRSPEGGAAGQETRSPRMARHQRARCPEWCRANQRPAAPPPWE